MKSRLSALARKGAAFCVAITLLTAPLAVLAQTDAFAVWTDNASADGQVARVSVPAGNYAVSAKLNLVNESALTVYVHCKLAGLGAWDINEVMLEATGNPSRYAVLGHLLMVSSSTQSTIDLTCQPYPVDVRVKYAKITAIRVDGKFSNAHTQ